MLSTFVLRVCLHEITTLKFWFACNIICDFQIVHHSNYS